MHRFPLGAVMHSEEAAFLAAIRAAVETGDQLPRLVFADWLEDRGDPRSAWVRDPEVWAFMAPDAADPVRQLISRREWELLRRLGSTAIPSLGRLLTDDSMETRRVATEALKRYGPAVAEEVPALVLAMTDRDVLVRRRAVYAAGELGPTAVAAVHVLIETLKEYDLWLPEYAAASLGKIGPAAAVAVPALIEALTNPAFLVRRNAAAALGKIGPAAKAAVAALRARIQNDLEVEVRTAAVTAVERITARK